MLASCLLPAEHPSYPDPEVGHTTSPHIFRFASQVTVPRTIHRSPSIHLSLPRLHLIDAAVHGCGQRLDAAVVNGALKCLADAAAWHWALQLLSSPLPVDVAPWCRRKWRPKEVLLFPLFACSLMV